MWRTAAACGLVWIGAVATGGAGEGNMQNVNEEVPYAEDGPGRRMLVNEKHLLVMQVALRPGQAVPHHNANSNVHLLVLEGTVTVQRGGQATTAPKGSFLPVAFGTPMGIRNDTDGNATFLVLKSPNPSEMPQKEP